MKKSVWIFLFAVMLPSAVLGWLALRSAEEQQIVFERRTAQLYQKETEALAGTVRDAVESERRQFGETVHLLLAQSGDPEKLAHDFANTLADAWPRKAIGFALDGDGKLISPVVTPSTTNQNWRKFLEDNRSFICGSEPATVYAVPNDNPTRVIWGPTRSKIVTNTTQGGRGGGERYRNEIADAQRRDDRNLPRESESRANPNDPPGAAGTNPAAGAFSPAKNAGPDESKALRVADAKSPAPRDPTESTDKLKQAASAPPAPMTLAEPAPANPSMPAVVNRVDSPGLAQTEKKGVPAAAAPGAFARSAGPIAPGTSALAQPAGDNPVTPAEDKSADLAFNARARRELAGNGQALGDTKDRVAAEGAKRAHPPARPEPKPGAAETVQAPVDSLEKSPELQSPKGERTAAKQQPVGQFANNYADGPLPTAPPATRKSPGGKLEGYTESDISESAKEQLKVPDADATRDQASKVAMNRQVEPQQMLGAPSAAVSMLTPETADFSKLTADSDEGIVSRFVQDKLEVIFWIRPPEAPEMIFGCLVEAANLADLWKSVLERHPHSPGNESGETDGQPGYVMTLLDDRGRPVATHPANAKARDWKRPFVASEIGEALPHWEAALYLASPSALADSARGLWRTLAFIIAGAVSLIALGGWLVVADARRQLALAQQKTDFVSTVSHELKTPLTSIRMFAELMHDRPQPPEKQGQYLRIITIEAERLTRLINNVLDFAKLGRKQKRVEKKPIDLHEIVARVWESQALHLREAGFETRWEAAPGPYPMLGDDDALSQALVNLFSNAEKYSPDHKEVQLHTWIEGKSVHVSVLDRGLGVPKGEERKIFEAFYRAHDSLSSGIQGSGLGLTLAQHVAQEHGGEITFERREGGGSRFTMRLLLETKHQPSPGVPAIS